MRPKVWLGPAIALSLLGLVALALPQTPAPSSPRAERVSVLAPKGRAVIEGLAEGAEDPRIEIRNYSWGVTNVTAIGGTGGGAGKATFDAFSFEKLVDESSVALARAVTTGSHFPEAIVTIFEPGTTTRLSVFALTDVTVSGVQHSFRSANVEQVSLTYSMVRWIYKAEGGDLIFCWDLVNVVSC